MTTTVTIEAHCPNTVEVEVTLTEEGREPVTAIMQDGETHINYVYDTRSLTIAERTKETPE